MSDEANYDPTEAWIEDATQAFLEDVAREVVKARRKFPDPYGCMCALTEEVGELAEAAMDRPYVELWKEAVQAATMALRVAVECDTSLNRIREARGVGSVPNPAELLAARLGGIGR